MKTDNELINDFLGYGTYYDSSYGKMWYDPTKKDEVVVLEMRYNKSWDWLHVAFDKWKKVARGYAGYHGWLSRLKESFTMTKVHQASKQMAKAIKWYNSQKQ